MGPHINTKKLVCITMAVQFFGTMIGSFVTSGVNLSYNVTLLPFAGIFTGIVVRETLNCLFSSTTSDKFLLHVAPPLIVGTRLALASSGFSVVFASVDVGRYLAWAL